MNVIHTLHILNKTPEHPRFRECLGMLGPDDALALSENGVLALAGGQPFGLERVYALRTDLSARGLSATGATVQPIDYPDLVELTLEAKRVISW